MSSILLAGVGWCYGEQTQHQPMPPPFVQVPLSDVTVQLPPPKPADATTLPAQARLQAVVAT